MSHEGQPFAGRIAMCFTWVCICHRHVGTAAVPLGFGILLVTKVSSCVSVNRPLAWLAAGCLLVVVLRWDPPGKGEEAMSQGPQNQFCPPNTQPLHIIAQNFLVALRKL